MAVTPALFIRGDGEDDVGDRSIDTAVMGGPGWC